VLRRIDRVLAPIGWIAAAIVVVMLAAGPAVIAEDKDNPSRSEAAGMAAYSSGGGAGGGGAGDPKTLFRDNCGSCHTLQKAGTSGGIGPPLDNVGLNRSAVENTVRKGRGGMPSFEGRLSRDQIRALAEYVAGGH
jgi:mono/diheme cytochrome c family protein